MTVWKVSLGKRTIGKGKERKKRSEVTRENQTDKVLVTKEKGKMDR